MERTEMIALLNQAQAALSTLVLQGTMQWQQGMTCDRCIGRVKQALQAESRKEAKPDGRDIPEGQ